MYQQGHRSSQIAVLDKGIDEKTVANRRLQRFCMFAPKRKIMRFAGLLSPVVENSCHLFGGFAFLACHKTVNVRDGRSSELIPPFRQGCGLLGNPSVQIEITGSGELLEQFLHQAN